MLLPQAKGTKSKTPGFLNKLNFKNISAQPYHTVETRAILELVFHEFDEKELLRAEFLWRP